MAQDSARPGTISVEPGTNSTRLLKNGRAALMPVMVVIVCGLSDSGLPSEQNTSVLAVAIPPHSARQTASGTKFPIRISGTLQDKAAFRRAVRRSFRHHLGNVDGEARALTQ